MEAFGMVLVFLGTFAFWYLLFAGVDSLAEERRERVSVEDRLS